MARIAVVIVFIIAGIYFLFFTDGDDPSVIDGVLTEAKAAGVERDLSGFMDNFSMQYRDEYGFSYLVIKRIVGRQFEKFEKFEAEYTDLGVVFDENEQGDKLAIATLDLRVKGFKKGLPIDLIGTDDSTDNINIEFLKSSLGVWKIVSVSGVDTRERF